MTDETLV